MKTIFCDIDGVLLKQVDELSDVTTTKTLVLNPGVLKKFNEWNWKNYKIVLTTGRKESTRAETEVQLKTLGLFWDVLIMGLDAGGERYLINNLRGKAEKKSFYTKTAYAINLKQNEGLINVNID